MQDVQPTKGLNRKIDHGLQICFTADIGGDKRGLSTRALDGFGTGLTAFAVNIGDDDLCALRSETDSGGPANARRRAGNDRYLIRQSHVSSLSIRRVMPRGRDISCPYK